MSTNLGFCLALHHAHASLQRKLDDELGLHHGISFNDFSLLNLLAQVDGGRVSIPELVRPLGQSQSSVVRQLIVLEKIGLVVREGANGNRQAVLRPAGRGLVNAARETADSICTEAVKSIAPAAIEMVSAALVTLARTPNLAISSARLSQRFAGHASTSTAWRGIRGAVAIRGQSELTFYSNSKSL